MQQGYEKTVALRSNDFHVNVFSYEKRILVYENNQQ